MSRARRQSVQALRPSQRQPPPAAPGKPLISRSFQAERQKAGDGHFGALPIKVTAEDKPQKEHDLGITLGRGETHRICEAPWRHAQMQFSYEDRIAELRAQVDRFSSRQLLDQEQYEQKLDQILRRQTALESRASASTASAT